MAQREQNAYYKPGDFKCVHLYFINVDFSTSLFLTFYISYASVKQRFADLRKELKIVDEEDKILDRKRRKEKRIKEKMKWKKGREGEEADVGSEVNISASDTEESGDRVNKKTKIYFDSDSDDGKRTRKDKQGGSADSISLAEQEQLALKLLSSMHS